MTEPERPGGPQSPAGSVYGDLLANERTFLAYVRTALALQLAGLGVLQFLTEGHAAVRQGLGLVLLAVGALVGAVGQRRWRDNDAAIRAGRELASPRVPSAVAVVVVLAPLVAGAMLLVG